MQIMQSHFMYIFIKPQVSLRLFLFQSLISKHTELESLKSPLNSSVTSRLPSSFSWTFILRTSRRIFASEMYGSSSTSSSSSAVDISSSRRFLLSSSNFLQFSIFCVSSAISASRFSIIEL